MSKELPMDYFLKLIFWNQTTMGPGHLKILKEPPVLEVIVVPFL
jgi:hypothetical protein